MKHLAKLDRPFPFEGWAIRFGELTLIDGHTATIEGDPTDSSGWRRTGSLKAGEFVIPLQMITLPRGRVAVQCLSQKGIVVIWSTGAHVKRP